MTQIRLLVVRMGLNGWVLSQAEKITLARALGSLSLSLRSLLDASKVSEEEDKKPDINTIRFGRSTR